MEFKEKKLEEIHKKHEFARKIRRMVWVRTIWVKNEELSNHWDKIPCYEID